MHCVVGNNLLITAKMEELEEKVPRIHTLTSLSGNIFSREQVLKMESWILNAFKWEVNIITPLNFLEYYLKEASLGPAEMSRNTHLRNYELTRAHLCKTAEFFVDLSEHRMYCTIRTCSTQKLTLIVRFIFSGILAFCCCSCGSCSSKADAPRTTRMD